jgi:hypothetical protein
LVFEAITTIGGLIAGIIAFLVGRLSSVQTQSFASLTASRRAGNTTSQEVKTQSPTQ